MQYNLLFCLFQLAMQSRQLRGIGRGYPSLTTNSDSISSPTSPHQTSRSENPTSPAPSKPSHVSIASQTTLPEEEIPPENVDRLVRQLQEERDQLLQTVFTQSAELVAAKEETRRQSKQVALLQESMRHLFLTGRLLSSDPLVADIDALNSQPLKPAQLESNSETSPCSVSAAAMPNSAALPRDDNSMTVTATASYKPSPVTQQLGRGKYKPPIAPLLSLDMTAYATKIGYTGYRRTPLPHATRRPQ